MSQTQLGPVQHSAMKHRTCLLRLNVDRSGLCKMDTHKLWPTQLGPVQHSVFEAPNLFAEIDRQAKWIMKEGKPQNVANTAWACATLGYEAPNLFAEIDRHLDGRLEEWNAQSITNTCYAIAILGLSKEFEASLTKLWERAIHLFVIGQEFVDKDFWQLAQTLIFAKANGVNLSDLPEMMTKRMESELARLDGNNLVSKSSQEISKLLHEIGFHHELEVSPDSTMTGGMMAIDMACKERKIAVEYDGPSHYLKALGSGVRTSTENGATKAKRRFLEQLGWNVINIDYREFGRVRRTPKEKQWLRKILKDWVSEEERTNGTGTGTRHQAGPVDSGRGAGCLCREARGFSKGSVEDGQDHYSHSEDCSESKKYRPFNWPKT